MISFISIFLLTLFLSPQEADFGHADPSIPELAQMEYYRGVWGNEMEMMQDGELVKLDFASEVTGKFLADHKTFQTEFTASNGFYSTDIRTYDIERKEWRALFLNADAQRWHEFTAQAVEDQMITMVPGGYSGKEDFDIKTVNEIVSATHYRRLVYQSTDNGETWVLTYRINARKK
ncbi:MAG: hypothetical protein RIF33_10550 [Cyclobacteriaceae bacterium]